VNSRNDRAFDIVLFGATGFTGELVAEYLAEGADAGTRWAIAGRDKAKLEAVHGRLGLSSDVAILIADSTDTDALRSLVAQTKVICTTVGPYAQLGTALLKACAEGGTDYCDLTGEVQWMSAVFDAVNPVAQKSGARLVHCCGFDSIPFDLGVFVAQEAMHERFGVYARHVRGRMGKFSGAFSGGTAASMLFMMEQATRDPSVRKRMMDPYALYPAGTAPGLDESDQMGARWDEVFDSWTGPFLMAPCNTRVIRRSNALLGFPYGTDFRYDESQLCGNRFKALGLAAGLGGFMGAALFPPTRYLVKKALPSSGEGPDRAARENGHFEYFVYAHHPMDSASDIRVTVKGKRDPGYGATSRMIAQSALCLAHDDLDVGGGIWTTASAMGRTLVKRLSTVDITFESD